MCEKMDPVLKAKRERMSRPDTDKFGRQLGKMPVVATHKCGGNCGCNGACGTACRCAQERVNEG